MPRVVHLRLEKLLEERSIPWAELAAHLGVSEALVRAYVRNRWTVLDRTVLERLADFFECDASSLLETSESPFFDPLSVSQAEGSPPQCIFLRRPDAETEQSGRKRSYRDNRAIEIVETFLRDGVKEFMAMERALANTAEIEKHFSHNCVVVGSPLVNPAAEAALCRIFRAKPFDSGEIDKVPLTFRVAATGALPASSVVEASSTGKEGIWLREENELIAADHWPPEEFWKVRIGKGRDCGFVAVMNHRPLGASGPVRKLVVIGGVSGAATEAAARALVDHYRDLEPREVGDNVWGVIEVFFHKAARTASRTIRGYRWRCRIGGRSPIDFTRRPRGK